MAEANRFAVATGNWNATSTWSATSGGTAGASVPDTDQHAIIESGNNVTIDVNDEIKSLTINGGGTLTGNASYSLTVNDEGDATYGTSGHALNIDGAIGANVNLIVTTQTTTVLDLIPSGGSIANLTINHADCNAFIVGNTTSGITNLTITAGSLNTDSGNNYALTVTGDVSVTGTLTGNASAISMGSLTIASGGTYSATSGTTTLTDQHTGTYYLLDNNGTFTHNNGTVTITDAGRLSLNTGTTATHTLNNLIINLSSSGMGLYGALTIDGDFTITSGGFSPQGQGGVHGTHVLGNTSVASAGVLGDGSDGSMTFHGLVTNLGELKLLQGQTYKFNGGLRQLGTFTTP